MEIAQVKYSGTLFRDMKPEDVTTWSLKLMVTLHTATGWEVPEDELGVVLQDQFRRTLTEVYGNCNPYEIEYAFRNYGRSVKNYGKQINLGLIDKVIDLYRERRSDISKKEERMIESKQLEAPKLPTSMSDQTMLEWIEDIKQQIKNGAVIDFMPPMVYEWLDKRGDMKLTDEDKKVIYDRAIQYRKLFLVSIKDDPKYPGGRKEHDDFMLMVKDGGKPTGDEKNRCKILARKIALYDYLKSLL